MMLFLANILDMLAAALGFLSVVNMFHNNV